MAEKDRLTPQQIAAFQSAWKEGGGSPAAVARVLQWSLRRVYSVRAKCAREGVVLTTTNTSHTGDARHGWQDEAPKWPKRREISVRGRSIVVGSDAHFWPGLITTAWRAFREVSRLVDPEYQILNGDTLDGARISRHDPIAWETTPELADEIECVIERLKEAQASAPNAQRLWTCGNHDTRFERYLSKNAPQMRNVKGSCLQDHTGWPVSWSIMVNKDVCPVMVKHAFRGGIHAVYNNTLHAGISIVTGHLHAQLVRPFTDYRGTRYGVDAGTLADLGGPQFGYTMDAPTNWRSGFAVLTFDEDGVLLPPELCEVQTRPNGRQRAVFRGQVVAEGESWREDVAA